LRGIAKAMFGKRTFCSAVGGQGRGHSPGSDLNKVLHLTCDFCRSGRS
jgi:hypothetical protein